MDFSGDLTKIKDLVDKAQDVLVVTHEHPTYDSIGSALALSLGLTSLGKKVTVACPDVITVELSSFVGVDKVTTEVTKRNFVISLDYIEGSIEKVSYNIEGNKFNLVIEPRPGFDAFTREKAHFSNMGSQVDLIFAIDTIHLGGLKKLYENDKELFATKPIINVDRHPNNSHFGQINLVDATVAATAELISQIFTSVSVKMTQDIATNLLNALYASTNNFQSPYTTSRTFDLASVYLKAGGRRFTKSITPQEELPGGESVKSEGVEMGTRSSFLPPTPQVVTPPVAGKTENQAPADWLKPKIFKSSSLL